MIKKLAALAIAASALAPAFAQTNVGVSIGINQPGVYGRIDIGAFPQPRLVYPQPVVIVQTPMAVQQQLAALVPEYCGSAQPPGSA